MPQGWRHGAQRGSEGHLGGTVTTDPKVNFELVYFWSTRGRRVAQTRLGKICGELVQTNASDNAFRLIKRREHTLVCAGGNEVRLHKRIPQQAKTAPKHLGLAREGFQGQKGPSQSTPSLNAGFVAPTHRGQAIFLPAPSSSSPGAVTEPGLLEGTKGAHNISPRCTAFLGRPRSQPPSSSPRFDSAT